MDDIEASAHICVAGRVDALKEILRVRHRVVWNTKWASENRDSDVGDDNAGARIFEVDGTGEATFGSLFEDILACGYRVVDADASSQLTERDGDNGVYWIGRGRRVVFARGDEYGLAVQTASGPAGLQQTKSSRS